MVPFLGIVRYGTVTLTASPSSEEPGWYHSIMEEEEPRARDGLTVELITSTSPHHRRNQPGIRRNNQAGRLGVT